MSQGLIVALQKERKRKTFRVENDDDDDNDVGGSEISHFPRDLMSRYSALQCSDPGEQTH